MKENLATTTIGEIMAADFRAAAIFEQFHIDFCCSGRRRLLEACRAADADPETVIRALELLPATANSGEAMIRWPIDQLIDHIVSAHHHYIRSAGPRIARDLAELEAACGLRHPEVCRTRTYFDQIRADLDQHLAIEEQVLFPYVRELSGAKQPLRFRESPFGSIEHPVRMMVQEHRETADGFRIIRELTNRYTAPAGSPSTYATCMGELMQFERNFHTHVHLENNILFPRAVELEQNLMRDWTG